MRYRWCLTLPWTISAALAQVEGTQRVEIVGSRLPRWDAETALPVQILRREEILRSGAATAEELLDRVSASSGGYRQAQGLNSVESPGLSAVSLRGLGAGETLVLLNGRRLANYAFTGVAGPSVDLHVIPLAAIERVEVLKDGASALYGSDAVAGVINFVTRQDHAGTEGVVALTGSEHGGGARARASLAMGSGRIGPEGASAFAVLSLQRQDALQARQRAFASTGYRPGLGLDDTLPPAFPANVILRSNGRFSLLNPVAPDCPAGTVTIARGCWYDGAASVELIAPSREATLLGRATWRLSATASLYAELLAAASHIRFAGSPTSVSFITSGSSGLRFDLPETSAYYPTALGLTGPLSLAYRTVPLGSRTRDVGSDNLRWLGGIKGTWQGWELDAATAFNVSRAHERFVSGYVGASALDAALATGLINPFGPSAPDGDRLLASTEVKGDARRATGRTASFDVRATRELMRLAGGTMSVAAGAEIRRESLRDEQTALARDVSAQVGAAPKSGQRTVQAAYAELLIPWSRGFEGTLAGRVDRYSDFGATFSPKLALRIQPARDLVARASVGKGFRAPSLPELYTQTTAIPAFTDVADPARCPVTGAASDCELAFTVTEGGNAALRPQRSVQSGLGLVLQASRSLQASLDLWSIRIRDLIGVQDVDRVLADIARYEGRNVVRGPVDPVFPGLPGPIVGLRTVTENLGNWRVSGADLSMVLKPDAVPWGRWGMRVDTTYVRRARQETFIGEPMDKVGRIAPRWQAVATLDADRGPWSGALSYRYRRGYLDANPLPDDALRRVAAHQVWDAQLGLALNGTTRVSLGIHNLFDRDPPFSNQGSSSQAGYDPSYADPLKRTWTLTLDIRR